MKVNIYSEVEAKIGQCEGQAAAFGWLKRLAFRFPGLMVVYYVLAILLVLDAFDRLIPVSIKLTELFGLEWWGNDLAFVHLGLFVLLIGFLVGLERVFVGNAIRRSQEFVALQQQLREVRRVYFTSWFSLPNGSGKCTHIAVVLEEEMNRVQQFFGDKMPKMALQYMLFTDSPVPGGVTATGTLDDFSVFLRESSGVIGVSSNQLFVPVVSSGVAGHLQKCWFTILTPEDVKLALTVKPAA